MNGFFQVDEHDAGGQRLRLPAGVRSEAAYFGPKNCYRLTLRRIWNLPGERRVNLLLWIMLNPSVATEEVDDRTLAKCRRASTAWGFDGMVICNAFAYRCTDSNLLTSVPQPLIIPENMRAIQTQLEDGRVAYPVVLGWGAPSNKAVRQQLMVVTGEIKALLRGRGRALALSADGHPRHPLYTAVPRTMDQLDHWPRR